MELLALIVFLIVVGKIFRSTRGETNESLKTTNAWCDAGKEMLEFFEKHPYGERYERKELKRILDKQLITYHRFLRAHPYCKRGGDIYVRIHIEYRMECMERYHFRQPTQVELN